MTFPYKENVYFIICFVWGALQKFKIRLFELVMLPQFWEAP